MTNTVKIIVLSVSFFLLAASVYAIVSIHETIKLEKDGRMLMQHIEVFCAEHGRLPDHSELLDCENNHSVGPFYKKTSDVTYSIYFCLGFDSYYKYDSDNKEWSYFPHQTKIQTMLQRIRKTMTERHAE